MQTITNNSEIKSEIKEKNLVAEMIEDRQDTLANSILIKILGSIDVLNYCNDKQHDNAIEVEHGLVDIIKKLIQQMPLSKAEELNKSFAKEILYFAKLNIEVKNESK